MVTATWQVGAVPTADPEAESRQPHVQVRVLVLLVTRALDKKLLLKPPCRVLRTYFSVTLLLLVCHRVWYAVGTLQGNVDSNDHTL